MVSDREPSIPPPRLQSADKAGGPSWFLLTLAGLAVLVLALVLYAFDPAQSSFYPGCWFHRLTGLLCPGCGGLRATHQLLHGNLPGAFHLNALLVLGLPVFAAAAGFSILRPASRWPVVCLYATLAASIAFGVLRNFWQN